MDGNCKCVKFLHVLWWNDIKFYKNLVDMIDIEFNPSEHLFITPYRDVYNDIKEYPNTRLVGEDGISLIKKYAKTADWIICHPIHLPIKDYLFIPPNIAHRLIWRTWGHDIRSLGDLKIHGKGVRRFLWKILFELYREKVKSFKAIGIANIVDDVNVKNVFGRAIKTYTLPYGRGHQNALNNINSKEYRLGQRLTILVGHNGNKADRHIEILESLRKFNSENIEILISLFIANDLEYVSRVKKCALEWFGSNCTFLEESMSYEKFANLIANTDICIMDNIYSNGLGTLSIIADLKRKLYVNKNGNIAQALLEKGVLANYTSDISKTSFKDFSARDDIEKLNLIRKYLGGKSEAQNIECWNFFLADLTK